MTPLLLLSLLHNKKRHFRDIACGIGNLKKREIQTTELLIKIVCVVSNTISSYMYIIKILYIVYTHIM